MAELSPMMKQYFETKKKYPDTILMFRLGDFYEMFFDDAVTASRELELVLTGRACGQEERAPMCGVPFHSADSYMARLVAKGYKVAICEQMEDPALAKGLVKREVVRVLTPGTVIENSMLNEGRNNFLASVYFTGESAGVCFIDVSTGSVNLTELAAPALPDKIINEIGRFMPSEIVFNSASSSLTKVFSFISNKTEALAQELGDNYFDPQSSAEIILRHFKKDSLSELELNETGAAVPALGAALKYLTEVQRNDLDNISSISFYSELNFMRLDVAALRNLEIVETLRNREKRGSLLWVLDKTRTPMGKRMIRAWLERPLLSMARITKRHNAVEELVSQPMARQELSESMSGIHDLERLITRISFGTAGAKDLRALALAASCLPELKEKVSALSSSLMQECAENMDTLSDIYELIDAAIVEEPPFSVREGGMIKDGFHPELDSLRDIVLNGEPFVPNDTILDCADDRCAIITGPNMAGKSTYMRQVALVCVMAQAGSFVPAASAELGIVDSVFTRIGASDDLSAGQSTFMVEMSEVASILNNATSRSLIIFDEIGRGTSTFDGMSIARAVLEYAADKKRIGAKTLFATHYHELTELEGQIDGVKNYNIAVKKRGDDITFLRRIVRGGADGSYGIEVAKLAGVPKPVVERAKKVLKELEESGLVLVRDREPSTAVEPDAGQISFGQNSSNEIVEKLKVLDVNTLTPIEAMGVLYELTKSAKEI